MTKSTKSFDQMDQDSYQESDKDDCWRLPRHCMMRAERGWNRHKILQVIFSVSSEAGFGNSDCSWKSVKKQNHMRSNQPLHLKDFQTPHYLEGLGMKGPVSAPPVEVQFAQKLAANDKKDR